MHNMKKYRLITFILFIALIVVLLFLSVNLYNASLNEGYQYNKSLILTCVILILIIGILKLYINYKLSDESKFNLKIKTIVEDEKAKILAKYDKQEIQEEKVNETEVNVDEIVKKIIPNPKNLATLKSYTEKVLSNIAREIEIVQGLFYVRTKKTNVFAIAGGYAFTGEKKPKDFKLGETLPGQAAKSKDILIVNQIPDNYYSAESGLGKSIPKNIIMIPIVNKNTAVGVMELGTFKDINPAEQKILKILASKLGDKISKFIK
jgi:putative methionine-R-sulfoxide reductase with GAF domain